MNHSKIKNKWHQAGKRSLLLFAVLSLVISLLGLPLYAQTMPTKSPAGRVVDGIKRGARDIGRGARDIIDPDGNGILPDGSLDNGIANDGNQFETGDLNGNVTDHVTGQIPDSGTSDGLLDEVLPDSPVTDGSRPSPDNGENSTLPDNTTGDTTDVPVTNGTTTGANTTDTPATTAETTEVTDENADSETEGGFRWTGLIIAIIIAVAVVVLICLLIPKKKTK